MRTPKKNQPGQFIRERVLPKGLAVKKAAEIMGVGRPALSNLLNGNAALTPEMAMRLEKAFGASSQELLALQAKHEEQQRSDQAKEIAVHTFVQAFMGILARHIAAWAEQISTRAELPAFLRRLVQSTGASLVNVDFPAYDNAQRHGWDGYVSCDAATPWIPRGLSGWEFGCDQNAAGKAEGDYAARTGSVEPAQRAEITFVFVTPRNWQRKEQWAARKRLAGEWKDVRAYDASDLEQWLEQSVPTQAWFGEKIGNGAPGTASLEKCWQEWADVSDPPLSKILFRSAIAANGEKLTAWLGKPPDQPFVVAAESQGEALAFLACALESIDATSARLSDQTLVLHDIDALKRAVASAAKFIAVVNSSEVEQASAGLHRGNHMLVVRRLNDVSAAPDVALGLVDDKTFHDALTAMEIPWGDQARYVRETAHSPTILRRRLSKIPAIHAPGWSTDKHLARRLIPLNLAGVWNSERAADREIMKLLTGTEYLQIETAVTDLLAVADAPVWSIGNFRGVMSKIDVLFASHLLVTKDDLENFFLVAEYVLSESDPALDLAPDKRWAAHIYGKSRDHSSVLRRGLCETLVLLAANGNMLFRDRLGIDVEARVNGLVRRLLTPLDTRTWASQREDLPRYAEAAPDTFLDIVEEDLASDQPKIYELLRPADTAPFSDCPRTGLIWALETVAWKPERLMRVSSILARLAVVPIADNWINTPEHSLSAIFRSWMPQTAASVDQRNQVLATLCEKFRSIGWRICVEQFGPDSRTGDYSARPHWRNDAVGAGEPVKTFGEIFPVQQKALQLALNWPCHDVQTLSDLVKRLPGIPEAERETVWRLIETWADTNPSDAAKHELRESIRTFAFTRAAKPRGVTAQMKDRARDAYEHLKIADPIMRHLWLFARHWVEESADELMDENFDYQKHEERVALLRKQALGEIWTAAGYDGVLRLCELGEASAVVGWLLAEGLISEGERIGFLDRLAEQPQPPAEHKIDNLLSGFLGRLGAEDRDEVISALVHRNLRRGEADRIIRVLKCSPFRSPTWKHLNDLPAVLAQRYWREAYVRWEGQDEGELNLLIDRLIEVERPRAAFEAVHINFKKVETRRLINLLRAVASSVTEPANRFRFNQFEISEAFKSLKSRDDIVRDELVQLEFLYAEVLDDSEYGIPTIEEELTKQPHLFIQVLALLYRRNDGGEDPPEWVIENQERRSAAATTAYNVLRRASRIPGTREDGSINAEELCAWVQDVRDLARAYGRVEVTDQVVGALLAKCPPDPDGVWPCRSVRLCLEAFASDDLSEGVRTGRYNLRGAHWRAAGGQQERDLAAQYRGWSEAIAFEYPFTAKILAQLAHSYDAEAVWQDNEEDVRKRLAY